MHPVFLNKYQEVARDMEWLIVILKSIPPIDLFDELGNTATVCTNGLGLLSFWICYGKLVLDKLGNIFWNNPALICF